MIPLYGLVESAATSDVRGLEAAYHGPRSRGLGPRQNGIAPWPNTLGCGVWP